MRMRFHHAAISVDDMEVSQEFYGHLGFQVAVEWADPSGSPRICHMKLGDVLLELFWFADRQPAPESAGRLETDLARVGCKHFALQVDSIIEARQFVEERGLGAGVSIQQGKTGVTYFFIKDPSGILVEFVEDPRELSQETL